MPINFRISALVPVGLILESVAQLDDSILIAARAGIQVASCPCVDRGRKRLSATPKRCRSKRAVRQPLGTTRGLLGLVGYPLTVLR